MTDREYILAGNFKLLDSLIQNRDDWKERAEKLENLLNLISRTTDKLGDSPVSLLLSMQTFSDHWKNNRGRYLD